MPRSPQGGTRMWCPECKGAQVCKGISPAKVTGDPADYAQRRYYLKHQDLQFFQRGRQCLACGYTFVTTECKEQFLLELMELRDALADIKANAESYISESKKASESLDALHTSLSVLKALKIYTDAGDGDT